MRFFRKSCVLPIFIGLFFFVFALLTLKDYNFMWDGRAHFLRGQSYLRFLATGKSTYDDNVVTIDFSRYYKDYLSRASVNNLGSFKVSDDSSYRRSIYKYGGYIIYKNAAGHPPFSDISAALFNNIFYEKLGLLRDDLAYNLFAVFMSSILVGLIFYWVRKIYGNFAAIISTITLATYPLFWAESHFNIKDIPLMAFFALSIFGFWQGVEAKSKKWIILSSVFAGFALATKFNTVFLPFIFIPWFLIFYFRQSIGQRQIYRKWWWLIPVYLLIMILILFASYPYLWEHPWNFLNVISYYKDIGLNIDYTPLFRTFLGFNNYSVVWITITTYPWILILALIGISVSFFRMFKYKDATVSLFLLWFLVPILRVSVPKSAIYDGVRQIMEFIPAMAILAGIGAYYIIELFKKLKVKQIKLIQIIIILLFIPLILSLSLYHPAENAYFNSLIGGLAGAKKAQITGWGNTDGGVYAVAVNWLNKNAEKNSHIATGFSDTADFYIPSLRSDLIADNQFSGYLQKGEYIVALTHDTGLEQTYRMFYPEKFLNPLFEYKIDGVTLMKIWRNEKKYLKKDILKFKERSVTLLPNQKDNTLQWDMGKTLSIVRVELTFANLSECGSLNLAYFQVSNDGSGWNVLPEVYPGGAIDGLGQQPQENKLIAPFAGIRARYISLIINPNDSCLFRPIGSVVTVLE